MTLQSSKLVSHRTFDQLLKLNSTCRTQAVRKFESNSNLRTANRHKIISRLGGLSFSIICSVALFPANVLAQITPDGSVPTTVEQIEEIMRINGGEREGNNLFHSFDEFSIPEGMEAVFENATDIENIFTRVTGESVSNIDGILSTQGEANFFFINPNGVVFGNDAQLNVGGSFVASTAESIEFEDGSVFSAKDENRPTITISSPMGLNLGSNPGAIIVNDSGHQITSDTRFSSIDVSNVETGLSVPSGQTFALVGNGINFNGGTINAEGGRIEIGSVDSGLVSFQEAKNGFAFGYDNAIGYKDITLLEQALLDVSGEGEGAISLTGDNVLLSNGSFLLNQNRGNIDSGTISVNALKSLKLSGTSSSNGDISSSIRSESLGEGQASNINISTKQLSVVDEAEIITFTYSKAPGSNVTVNASNSIELAGGNISNTTFAEGNAGDIQLSTSQLEVTNKSVITSSTFGTGDGGEVNINADVINVIDNSEPSTDRTNISASSFNAGNANNLTINTRQLRVKNGASVSSSSAAGGNAGNLIINSSESVEISGSNPNFQGSNTSGSTIRTSVQAASPEGQRSLGLPAVPTGNAGNLTINTPSINVFEEGAISVENQGTGDGGILSINADNLNLDTAGSITAASASGNGGNINLNTDDLQIDNDSQINAEAGNNGEGGNITINTSNLTTKKNSNLTTSAVGGDGGNINITADAILGVENSDITANAVGGNGGDITITSDYLIGLQQRGQLTSNSDITASSEFGLDGNIELNSPESLSDKEIAIAEEFNFTSTQDLIDQTCSAEVNNQNVGTITNKGRGGIPESPDNYFDTPVTSTPTVTPNRATSSSVPVLDWQPGDPIIEANAVRINSNGSISLVALPQFKPTVGQSCSPFSILR
jgi:filamentous hemagglutinin family protein